MWAEEWGEGGVVGRWVAEKAKDNGPLAARFNYLVLQENRTQREGERQAGERERECECGSVGGREKEKC